MKILIMLLLSVFAFQSHAGACKCNCDSIDISLCASSYDLDHPCNGACPSPGLGIAPMRTACPLAEFINPFTGRTEWRVLCME